MCINIYIQDRNPSLLICQSCHNPQLRSRVDALTRGHASPAVNAIHGPWHWSVRLQPAEDILVSVDVVSLSINIYLYNYNDKII